MNTHNDSDVIEAFVASLRSQRFPELRVERWPDKENRRTKDIDAIAGLLAIEHTSIDSVENQRRNDDWYLQVIGGLEKELSSFKDFNFKIIFEFNAIKKGQDWKSIRADLKKWILENAATLPFGSYKLDLPTTARVDPPIKMHINKNRRSHRGFARFGPEDNTLSERVKQILDRKAAKLEQYQKRGFTTLLLVENGDIALMCEQDMLLAIHESYSGNLPHGVDQVWFADTSIRNHWQFVAFKPDQIEVGI